MILFGVLFEVGVLIYMFSLVILLKYLIIAIEFTRVVLYTATVDEQA